MGKIKNTEYSEYENEFLEEEEEDFEENDLTEEEEEELLESDQNPGYKRNWRDAEKYKEMRELYKIINDELYTGFDEDDYMDEEG